MHTIYSVGNIHFLIMLLICMPCFQNWILSHSLFFPCTWPVSLPKPRMCCTWQALTDLSRMITLTMITLTMTVKEENAIGLICYLTLFIFSSDQPCLVVTSGCIEVMLFGTYYLKAPFLPLNNDRGWICLFPNLSYSCHIPGGTENISDGGSHRGLAFP